jgi:hypothetical protein
MNPSLHELVFPWSNKITKLFIGNRLHFHFFFFGTMDNKFNEDVSLFIAMVNKQCSTCLGIHLCYVRKERVNSCWGH